MQFIHVFQKASGYLRGFFMPKFGSRSFDQLKRNWHFLPIIQKRNQVKLKLIFSLLSVVLSASMAEAIICRVDVLKRVINGQDYFLHCLAVMPCECLSLDLNKQRGEVGAATFRRIQTAFKEKLDQMTAAQGEELVAYAQQLGVGQFILINEDLFEYAGKDEVLGQHICRLKGNMKQRMTIGEIGLLSHATDLFKERNWPLVNADCRQVALNAGQKERIVASNFFSLLAQLNNEVTQSSAPPELKEFSKMRLDVTRLEFTSLRKLNLMDQLGGLVEKLVDARIPHLIAQQSNIKHILLLIEGQRIDTLIEPLSSMGYQSIGSAGKHATKKFAIFQDDITASFIRGIPSGDISALDIALNLKKAFATIGKMIGLPMPTLSEEDDEKKIIHMSSNSISTQLVTMAILCADCGQAKQEMQRCPRCKAVWYCSTECLEKHWQVCEEKE